MTGDTRLAAVFGEQGVGGGSPAKSLHPENVSHDLPRCSLRLDSVHARAPYKSGRSLISNAFYSLSGMTKLTVWDGRCWVPKGGTKYSMCVYVHHWVS